MADEMLKIAEDSARGGFFLISGTAVSTFIMAISAILVGRFLGPELYGQYALVLVVPSLLFNFTDLGINQGIIKFTATFRSRGETHKVAKIIKYGLLIRASVGIVLSIVNYAFADLLAAVIIQRPELGFCVRVSSISVFFQVVLTVVVAAFVGLDKAEFSAFTSNLNAISKAAISIALVLLGFGVVGAVIGAVAGYVVAGVVGLILLLFFMREKYRDGDNCSVSGDLKSLIFFKLSRRAFFVEKCIPFTNLKDTVSWV